ncbi:unnamed protein product [Sphagnum jensenii]|uniref:Uncharacterized protein n=1 Tax=Sphagnum jensenii TaxID=128206 RepID=A0ABP1BGV4_9BRYO
MSLSLQGTSFRDLDRRADRVNHAPMASKLTRHATVELKTAFSLVVSDWQVSESSTWTTSTGHRECTRRSQEEDLGPDAHGIGKSRMASIDIMRPPIVTRSGRRIPWRRVSSS